MDNVGSIYGMTGLNSHPDFRDWNEEFQSLIEQEDSYEKYQKVANLGIYFQFQTLRNSS
jgi:hypothetical protein